MSRFDGTLVKLFAMALRTWRSSDREDFGASMLEMFNRRLQDAPRFIPARAAWAVREVLSVAWQGIRARVGRGVGGGHRMGWSADARYALRTVLRRPGFTFLLILTLGGGLGLVVSSFTVVQRTLLEPLPYPDGDRLMALWSTQDGKATRWGNLSWLDLSDLRSGAHSLAALGGYTSPQDASLTGTDHPTLVNTVTVTEGFFDVFDIRPERGRLIEDDDHRAGGVALLSHDAWVSRFGADPGVLGRVIQVDDEATRVVGILPADARWFPSPDVEVWLPYVPGDQSRGSRNLLAVARLATGATLTSATAEIHSLADDFARAYPDVDAGRSADLHPLADQMMGAEVPRIFELLLAATVVLLLLSCANVAGLHLARASDRTRELAVQVSLGASRVRVVRPLILESLFVALLGGAVAVGLAAWLPGFVLAHAPVAIPRASEVRIDGRVLAFAGGLSLVTALLSAAVPAWSAARQSLRGSLAGEGAHFSGRRSLRTREVLVVGQVAGALALLAAAGLLVRSAGALSRVDPGLDPRGVLSASMRLESARYPDAASIFSFQDEVQRSLGALPGVERVAGISMLPFSGDRLCDDVSREGDQPTGECTQYRSITPGYFAAMGIPLLAGRDVAREDRRDAPRVAVISAALARTLFPAGEAVGGHIQGREESWEVVGVAGDVSMFGLADAPPPTVYLPFRQAPFRLLTAVIRAHDAEALAPVVSQAIWSVDPLLAVKDVTPLADLVSASAAMHRFRSSLFTAFGVVAVGIALLGISGLLLQTVHQRRREIGIRMALGSTAGGVVRSVLQRAALLAVVGAALGWVVSLLAGRALAGFLFGVSPGDPVSTLCAFGLVALTSLAAAAGPALQAASVDPVRTLKDD